MKQITRSSDGEDCSACETSSSEGGFEINVIADLTEIGIAENVIDDLIAWSNGDEGKLQFIDELIQSSGYLTADEIWAMVVIDETPNTGEEYTVTDFFNYLATDITIMTDMYSDYSTNLNVYNISMKNYLVNYKYH